MPQYLVAIQHPENYDPSLEGEAMIRDIGALNEEMDAAGARFFAGGLESASHAKSLRKQRDGNVSITDGPYLEAKEHIGGFWILLPGESEVHALVALMELQASRNVARRGKNGEAVLLPDQDRSLWNYAQIQRGMTALEQAQRLGGGAKPYALQAAIAACHMRARTAEETDWDRIVLLYDALLQINPSPIVALNRAVAVGMVQGPAAGLDALDAAAALAGDSSLAGYHLFPSVRGDLLMKMGRLSEAREEIQRAIAMTKNLREQELLANRLKQLERAAFSV